MPPVGRHAPGTAALEPRAGHRVPGAARRDSLELRTGVAHLESFAGNRVRHWRQRYGKKAGMVWGGVEHEWKRIKQP